MFRRALGRIPVVYLSVVVLLVMSIYISMTNGSFDLSVGEIVRTLLGFQADPDSTMVIFDYRMPRVVVAAIVGFGLGLAGAVVQGVTKNGLADPGILGISAGAGAGIMVCIFFFQGTIISEEWFSVFIRPLFGWIGGMTAALIIFVLSWRRGVLDVQRFILIGIAISAMFGAVSLYLSLKMEPEDFQKAAIWVSGSIYHANWMFIASILPWMILLTPIILFKHRVLDLFQLGDTTASSLGVKVNWERVALILCSIGVVSACVSIAGNITFIGLIAPHITRQLVGFHHRYIFPVSGLIGMLLVLIADFLARTITPTEVPVGIVAAIIGIPYFLFLLVRGKV